MRMRVLLRAVYLLFAKLNQHIHLLLLFAWCPHRKLDRNRLNLSTLWPGAFRGLDSLSYLALSQQRTSRTGGPIVLNGDVFRDVPELDELHVDANGIARLAAGTKLPRRLAILHAEGNEFTDLAHVGLPASIKKVYLDQNFITRIKEFDLAGLVELQQLDLISNHVTDVAPFSFRTNSKLKILDLRDNRLRALPPYAMAGLVTLTDLRITGPSKDVTHLRGLLAPLPSNSSSPTAKIRAKLTVSIQDCGLTTLDKTSFGDQQSPLLIRYLLLTNNAITAVGPGTFAFMPQLAQLFLDDNMITELAEGVFTGLAELQLLELTDNRIALMPAGGLLAATLLYKSTPAPDRLRLGNNPMQCRLEGTGKTKGSKTENISVAAGSCECVLRDSFYVGPPHSPGNSCQGPAQIADIYTPLKTQPSWSVGPVHESLFTKTGDGVQEQTCTRTARVLTVTTAADGRLKGDALVNASLNVEVFGSSFPERNSDSLGFHLAVVLNGSLITAGDPCYDKGLFELSYTGTVTMEAVCEGIYLISLSLEDRSVPALRYGLPGALDAVVIQQWRVTATPHIPFATHPLWNPQAEAATYGLQDQYFVNSSYSSAPTPPKEDLFVHVFDKKFASVTYAIVLEREVARGSFGSKNATMSVNAGTTAGVAGGDSDLPGTFFVGSNGATLFIPQHPGKYKGTVVAADGSGARTPVFEWKFSVRGAASRLPIFAHISCAHGCPRRILLGLNVPVCAAVRR